MSVRASSIANAGLGVFATDVIFENQIVTGCTYGGDVLTFVEARCTTNKDYLMALHFNVHVDASCRSCLGYLGRYVNDLRGGDGDEEQKNEKREFTLSSKKENNVVFVKDVESRSASLKALRAIAVGEELTAAYGEQYWRHRRLEREGRMRDSTSK